ncbi:MAG: alpha/beta hydrolase [Microbacterium gubbeenense]|uniref:alpha/beta hydrolase n=1 Tax=Microbacterium gubbeenense TaxID=159896 RepID=UPI003F9BE4E4
MAGTWIPDVLGDEFEQLTLPLEPDNEGEVVATLVRALPKKRWFRRRPLEDVDVLYVHGWSDYFFQKRVARTFTELGARFYALDLRKYGRSLREGQSAGYVDDLATYDEDIRAALDAIGSGRRLVLFGHSTGGLVLSLWAHRNPGAASAVILNSPWLELQLPKFQREAITPLIEMQARRRPMDRTPQIDLGFYSRAQAAAADPEDPIEYNFAWRPEQSMSVHIGWLSAILRGHDQVEDGLAIDVPILVMLSARSARPLRWSDDLTRADSVLIVDDIARAALGLGPLVTVARIEGALHDVFVSRRDARAEAYRVLTAWAERMLPR